MKEFTHKHFTIRSTWVYGEGKNFVNALLQSAETETASRTGGRYAHCSAPRYAVLDNFILRIIDVYDMPTWRESLKEYLEA